MDSSFMQCVFNFRPPHLGRGIGGAGFGKLLGKAVVKPCAVLCTGCGHRNLKGQHDEPVVLEFCGESPTGA
jgi:hypothetical protein